ncbi:MAG: hypothetical protein FJ291_33180, partial [Planctomycetes bacterium]|nr:hypothetical protein [Planctomycetota bacterium]
MHDPRLRRRVPRCPKAGCASGPPQEARPPRGTPLRERGNCRLPSAICRLPTAVCRLPSALCRLPSAVRRLPPAVCRHPTARRHRLPPRPAARGAP